MTAISARGLIADTLRRWRDDPDTDVVWSGKFEGRLGVRIAQRCRDFTTIWFDVGERTVRFEAFLLPLPPHRRDEALQLCLARNRTSWPGYLALDAEGDLVVTGRVPTPSFTVESLDMVVGAVYETVELTFRPLLQIGFMPPPDPAVEREKTR